MSENMQKILVTGAHGFVGSAVFKELVNCGKYSVVGLVNSQSIKNPENFRKQNLLPIDITEYESFGEVKKLENVKALVHCAGLAHQFGRTDRKEFWSVNVLGTENMCRMACETGVEHFILLSSVAVYGDYGKALIDESYECHPKDDYAESKLAAEERAAKICEKQDLRLTILRLATVVGEGDPGNTTRLITKIDGNRFLWVGSGVNKKSLIYKGDVAKSVLKVLESVEPMGTNIYNISAGSVTMSEIVKGITSGLQKKTPRLRIPANFARSIFRFGKLGRRLEPFRKLERTIEKWLSDDIFSGEKFQADFDFQPEIEISEALARQVVYYLEKKNTG